MKNIALSPFEEIDEPSFADLHSDNFEYPENHADIFDTAAQNVPVYGAIRSIGNLFGGGPDISQRQKDFNTYSQAGFVKGGDPKDDNTWIFDLDWLKSTSRTDPWVSGYRNAIFNGGSPNAGKIMQRWADYKLSQGAQSKPVPTPSSYPVSSSAPTFTAPPQSSQPAPIPQTPFYQGGQGAPNQQSQPLQTGASLLQSGANFATSTWIMVAIGGVIVLGVILYFANK